MKTFFKFLIVLIVVLVCTPTVFPLFHSGFFSFHDNTQVVRVFEMSKSLKDGMFPVRWVEDLGYGYGYPIFNFYGPLPYYVGGVLVLTGFSALVATKCMFVIGILLSAVTMFFFSKRFFGSLGGVLSAVFYSYFPYHAVNIYVRGAVGEFYAYAFLPLVFLGLFRLLEIKEGKNINLKNFYTVVTISLGIFLVAVSHNLTLFMLLLLIVPLSILIIALSKQKKDIFILILISIVFGLLLSAFYILPAFLEMNYTNVSSQIGGGSDFHDHFVCFSQYLNSPWGFGGSTKGCIDGLSFKLGKFNILLFAVSILLLVASLFKKRWRVQEKLFSLSIVFFVFSIFLTLEMSKFIWESIPLMSYLQFPWRFINFISLFMAFSVGFVIFYIEEQFGKKIGLGILIIVVGLIILSSSKLFVPQSFNSFSNSFYTQKTYINYTVSKISDEYLPKNFSKPSSVGSLPKNLVSISKGKGEIFKVYKSTKKISFSFKNQTETYIHINIAFYPSWKGYVNGKEVKVLKSSNGMDVKLPKGSGSFALKFSQTPVEILGNTLSTIAFLALILGIILKRRSK
jgi:uncharacterized membrane protein